MLISIGETLKKVFSIAPDEPFSLKKLQDRAIQKRIQNGEFFSNGNIPPKICEICGKSRSVVAAKSPWQNEFLAGYFMYEQCVHDNIPSRSMAIYQSQSIAESQYVVRISATQNYYITENERDAYVEAFKQNPNLKFFKIRDYVLTRMYDIFPAWEFEALQKEN